MKNEFKLKMLMVIYRKMTLMVKILIITFSRY